MRNELLLQSVMEQYTDYLFRIAFYYTRDIQTSEDLVQDVFIKFYLADYKEEGNISHYLARLTSNRCKDYLKSWAYKKIYLQTTIFHTLSFKIKDTLIENEELTELDKSILALPLKIREVITLYYLEEKTIKDISIITKTPESTIKSRIQKGKKILKNTLADFEWEVLLNE